ncbi:bifunctional heptose 7-phosphate kinase/heptose 1-phosphate adenyltransferase [Lewinella sp. W8]|uniref:bifunctional heptose 7-phosphate kinase/heptose 1-phosphate adenyltransferase n=1 Tax=Lewinella sp. W8 TaxID=2528208 RepID=UPI001067E887|nr:bifunctional ADP-heptose synthase [Lewinella sp. W8]MTB50885.1 carbohydrate kinase [Lewinella sp. W8]
MDFSSLRILVVGDVMIDRYLDGRVDRISPEAPVPVMLLEQEENRLGGAANVALNLRALGAQVMLAGTLGEDPNAAIFRQLLTENAIGGTLLFPDANRPTTVKTRLVAQGQQLLRVDREETHAIGEAMVRQLLEAVEAKLKNQAVDLILLQDYNKGLLTESLIRGMMDLCQTYQVRSAVDPKKDNFWAYRGVSLFKPNLREIQAQCEFAVLPELTSLDQAAQHIFDKTGAQNVMITLSEHGIYVHDGNRSAIYPTNARDVADVSGAGDTVISVAACGLAAGMPLGEIAQLANLAGAQVIAKSGVVAVDLAELLAARK